LEAVDPVQATVSEQPAVVDDFIRNYLSTKGLTKTLDIFQVRLRLDGQWLIPQNEWYTLTQLGKLAPEDDALVSDVYVRNQELEKTVDRLRVEVEEYRAIAKCVP
jgi:hypothetical protein